MVLEPSGHIMLFFSPRDRSSPKNDADRAALVARLLPTRVLLANLPANHGAQATLPQVAGVLVGIGMMVLPMVAGLATPLTASPLLHDGLR